MQKGKLCFVVGPIGSEGDEARVHADWVLHYIIKPVLDKHPDFEVRRADHDPTPGMITSQMINDLLNAELVIADLAFLNPNAFYEIGIRHMAVRPIIHLNPDKQKIPFDLSPYRTVQYSRLTVQDIDKAKAELGRMVEAVLAESYQVENPVTAARGRAKAEEHATPEMQLVLAELDGLKSRMTSMEASLVTSANALPQVDTPFFIYRTPEGNVVTAPFTGKLGMVPPGTPSFKLGMVPPGNIASMERGMVSPNGPVVLSTGSGQATESTLPEGSNDTIKKSKPRDE